MHCKNTADYTKDDVRQNVTFAGGHSVILMFSLTCGRPKHTHCNSRTCVGRHGVGEGHAPIGQSTGEINDLISAKILEKLLI